MINSIQRFGEKGIKNLEEVVGSFVKSPTDISGFVLGIQEQVLKLALDIIGETFENCDNEIVKAKRESRNGRLLGTTRNA